MKIKLSISMTKDFSGTTGTFDITLKFCPGDAGHVTSNNKGRLLMVFAPSWSTLLPFPFCFWATFFMF